MAKFVFQAVILPLQSTIQLVLTSNTKTKDTGVTVVALGAFELDMSAIYIGELLIVDTADNPSPSKSQICATTRENLTLVHVNNKGADQPAHPRSLISAFVIRYLLCIVTKLLP